MLRARLWAVPACMALRRDNPPGRRLPTRTRLRRVDVAHRQANAPLPIDLQHLHANHIALFELVADALDALVRDLRDVHEPVAARQYRHESAEVHEARDASLVDMTHFDVRRDEL